MRWRTFFKRNYCLYIYILRLALHFLESSLLMTYLNWIYTYINISTLTYLFTHSHPTFTNPSKEAVIMVDDWESNAISMMTWTSQFLQQEMIEYVECARIQQFKESQNQIFEGDKETSRCYVFVCARLLWELNFWKGNLEAGWEMQLFTVSSTV